MLWEYPPLRFPSSLTCPWVRTLHVDRRACFVTSAIAQATNSERNGCCLLDTGATIQGSPPTLITAAILTKERRCLESGFRPPMAQRQTIHPCCLTRRAQVFIHRPRKFRPWFWFLALPILPRQAQVGMAVRNNRWMFCSVETQGLRWVLVGRTTATRALASG